MEVSGSIQWLWTPRILWVLKLQSKQCENNILDGIIYSRNVCPYSGGNDNTILKVHTIWMLNKRNHISDTLDYSKIVPVAPFTNLIPIPDMILLKPKNLWCPSTPSIKSAQHHFALIHTNSVPIHSTMYLQHWLSLPEIMK